MLGILSILSPLLSWKIYKFLRANSSSERSKRGVTPHALQGFSFNLARFLSKFDCPLKSFFWIDVILFISLFELIKVHSWICMNTKLLLDPWEWIEEIQKTARKQRIIRFFCIFVKCIEVKVKYNYRKYFYVENLKRKLKSW